MAVMKFCGIFCPINAYYVAVCRYIDTFINDLTITLNTIDELNRQREATQAKESKVRMQKKFIEAMEFHIEILK